MQPINQRVKETNKVMLAQIDLKLRIVANQVCYIQGRSTKLSLWVGKQWVLNKLLRLKSVFCDTLTSLLNWIILKAPMDFSINFVEQCKLSLVIRMFKNNDLEIHGNFVLEGLHSFI